MSRGDVLCLCYEIHRMRDHAYMHDGGHNRHWQNVLIAEYLVMAVPFFTSGLSRYICILLLFFTILQGERHCTSQVPPEDICSAWQNEWTGVFTMCNTVSHHWWWPGCAVRLDQDSFTAQSSMKLYLCPSSLIALTRYEYFISYRQDPQS